ncbi:nucleoporin Nup186 [Schizosaccharomyces japonicus yFS275]|uniref:Nucleoporin Nup186 n=1 Tax=Schizosaccharomyces japonicus (strain yFS275 / FY16936) TaxID=402676 RepID=B6K3J6_SCHJY|nr:nucleoporin Nup186 [Schizosaccharomyces japonicus yFS275]EEB08053.1 nucleoporin Nup186 [Schizosaccharomyces japonicus yFS275]
MEKWKYDHYETLIYLLRCIEANPSGSGISPRALSQALEYYIKDFQALLSFNPKNDQSRKKVQSGEVELDDVPYKLNQQFIDQALTLSDQLSVDELEAAYLLQLGIQLSTRLDRKPIPAGVYVCYKSRHDLLDVVETLTRLLLVKELDVDLKNAISDFFRGVRRGQLNFAAICLENFLQLQNQVADIRKRGVQGQLIGSTNNAEIFEFVKFSLETFTAEQETLSIILHQLASSFLLSQENYESILNNLKGRSIVDNEAVLLLPVLFSYLKNTLHVEIPEDGPIYFTKCSDNVLEQFYKGIVEDNGGSWCCPSLKQIVGIWWVTVFSEACKLVSQVPNFVDYDRHIVSVAKSFIHQGAFSHFVTFLISPFYEATDTEINWNLIQPRSTVTVEWLNIRPKFKDILFSHLRAFLLAFVSFMPDTLKSLRLDEEDTLLTQQSSFNDTSVNANTPPVPPLEEFYILLSSVYAYNKDWCADFWNDEEGDMYGFLTWSMNCQIPGVISAFIYLLVSLCQDASSALKLHELLSQGSEEQIGEDVMANHSWTYIFNVLQYYISQLKPVQTVITSSGMARVYTDPGELDEVSAQIVQSYIVLLATVIRHEGSIAKILTSRSELNVLPTLFDLLECNLQPEIKKNVLKALTALAYQSTYAESSTMWTLLDNWLVTSILFELDSDAVTTSSLNLIRSNIVGASDGSGPLFNNLLRFTQNPSIRAAFIELLTSLCCPLNVAPETLSFPEGLGQAYRGPGIKPYVDFVILSMVESATTWKNTHELDVLHIYRSSLEFMLSILKGLNFDLLLFSRPLGQKINAYTKCSSLQLYLARLPALILLEAFYTESVYMGLFELTEIDFDQIEDVLVPKIVTTCVHKSLQVIEKVLSLQNDLFKNVIPLVPEMGINKDVLDLSISRRAFGDVFMTRTSTIVQIVLLVGSRHEEIASSSLRVLSYLLDTDGLMNRCNTEGSHRLFSIIRTAAESRRIMFGFIRAFEESANTLLNIPNKSSFLLEMLLENLKRSGNEFSLSLMLLGFDVSFTNQLTSSKEPGFVGSNVSLFHSMVELVSVRTVENVNVMTPKVVLQAMEILSHLCVWPYTSELTLTLLREKDGLLPKLINVEPILQQDDIQRLPNMAAEEIDSFTQLILARAQIMNIIVTEIHQTHTLNLQKHLETYVKSLICNSQSVLVPTLLTRKSSSFRVMDFMDIMRIDRKRMTSDIPSSLNSLFKVFISNKLKSSNNGEIDTKRVADAYTLLLNSELEVFTGSVEEKQNWQKSQTDKVEKLLVQLDEYNSKILFIEAIDNCLEVWARLVGILVQHCSDFVSDVQFDELIWDLLRFLLPQISDYTIERQNVVFVISSLIETIVPFSLKRIREINNQTENTNFVLDNVSGVIQGLVAAIQCPASSQVIRENLYGSILYVLTSVKETLQGDLSDEKASTKAVSGKSAPSLASSKIYTDGFLDVIIGDALYTYGFCWELSVLVLNALHKFSPSLSSRLHAFYLRRNFIGSFVDVFNRFLSDLLSSNQSLLDFISEIESGMCLLIQLSQNKAAEPLVLNLSLMQVVLKYLYYFCEQSSSYKSKAPALRVMIHFLQMFVASLMINPLKRISSEDKAFSYSILTLSRKLQDFAKQLPEAGTLTEAHFVKKYVEMIGQIVDLHHS